MDNEIIKSFLLIFFVLDPFGNLPFVVSILKNLSTHEYKRTIIREVAIAYFIIVLFFFMGEYIFEYLRISQSSVMISGGIILFIIAFKMIFSSASEAFSKGHEDTDVFIVPIATPGIAGPASLATVSLMSAQSRDAMFIDLIGITLAVLNLGLILYFGMIIKNRLGPRGLLALERLTGMLLIILSVEMITNGIKLILHIS